MRSIDSKSLSMGLLFSVFIALVMGLHLMFQNTPNLAAQTLPETTTSTNTTNAGIGENCRYGIAVTSPILEWLPTFGAGWYVTFSTSGLEASPSEFVPIIRIHQDKEGDTYLPTYSVVPPLTESDLGQVIRSMPGKLWLIGNEPDVQYVQDDTYPDVYAHAYHEVYQYIKAQDPTAQVGIAGLSMLTPARLQYLDIVWNTYLAEYHHPMPVDVWNAHLYILPERRWGTTESSDGKIALGTDPLLAKMDADWGNPALCDMDEVYCRAEHSKIDLFIEQLRDFRIWMKAHGQQNKPLILSEYSILYPYILDDPDNPNACFLQDEQGNCFTPERVTSYMSQTFDYLETAVDPTLGYPKDNNRLVQQWLWYSMVTNPEETGGSSNLLKQEYANYSVGDLQALTMMGQNFRGKVAMQGESVNLLADKAINSMAFVPTVTATTTVTVGIDFYNNGVTPIHTPLKVTFYANAAHTQIIGSTMFYPAVRGCARDTYTAVIQWRNLGPGIHRYWAEVDTGHTVLADDHQDNFAQGVVMVNPYQVFIPIGVHRFP